jgi:hypothetical protein
MWLEEMLQEMMLEGAVEEVLVLYILEWLS